MYAVTNPASCPTTSPIILTWVGWSLLITRVTPGRIYMQSTSFIQYATLFIALLAAGSASYAALFTGRLQSKAAESQRSWQRKMDDRVRRLDQRRDTYESQLKAATWIEQLLWHAANRNMRLDELSDDMRENIRFRVRDHAAEHAALQLLGSPPVVTQADVLGVAITLAFSNPTRVELLKLSKCRTELMSLMRRDLELEEAAIADPVALYSSSKT